MADNKSKRGPADRTRVNLGEDYEVEYWSNHFGISPERLEHLVKKHGVMADEIARALGKKTEG
jgi:hypothetical protein